MVTSNQVLDIIKKIISLRYNNLAVNILGKKALTKEELKQLKDSGVEVQDKPSLLELAYYHSLLVPPGVQGPTSVEDMRSHQKNHPGKISKPEIDYALEHSMAAMKLAIDKMKQDQTSRILNIIQENNQHFKFNYAKNADQDKEVQRLIKESTVAKLKSKLRDSLGDANRDWQRIAVTEVSHAIAMGAADRVIEDNIDKKPSEIYTYKIPVNDSALCKFCRDTWLDSDGSPKVYTLSYLLGNGSNNGKKRSDWLPTVSPSHPNDRESGIIELKPGWKVLPGGRQTYIGLDKWKDYIINKIVR